jgi:hypothetical protein
MGLQGFQRRRLEAVFLALFSGNRLVERQLPVQLYMYRSYIVCNQCTEHRERKKEKRNVLEVVVNRVALNSRVTVATSRAGGKRVNMAKSYLKDLSGYRTDENQYQTRIRKEYRLLNLLCNPCYQVWSSDERPPTTVGRKPNHRR